MELAEKIRKLIKEEQAELAEKVNDILNYLNAIRGEDRIDYPAYSWLFDAVSDIAPEEDAEATEES